MSITSRFRFVGEALLPKDLEKFNRNWKGSATGTVPMATINFGVKENSNNVGYVSLFGMERAIIKTRDRDNKNIDIKWAERLNPEVIEKVAGFRKITVDLGEDFGGNHEFITELDAIDYLAQFLPKYHGKIEVRGTWKKEPYKGKINDRYELSSVRAVADDTVSKLQLTMDFFYNKDSIDESDFARDKKIIVDGYVAQYVDKDSGTMYFPQRAVLNAAKYDMENPKHVAKWQSRKGNLEKLSAKKMHHLYWECRLVNGVEEVEFDESKLTARQREQIELGIRTLDYFKPRSAIYGEKISEVRLFDAIFTGDFADGIIDADESLKEFEDLIFSFNTKEETIEEIEDLLATNKPAAEEDDDDDSLF